MVLPGDRLLDKRLHDSCPVQLDVIVVLDEPRRIRDTLRKIVTADYNVPGNKDAALLWGSCGRVISVRRVGDQGLPNTIGVIRT